jgi:hypothetical protein
MVLLRRVVLDVPLTADVKDARMYLEERMVSTQTFAFVHICYLVHTNLSLIMLWL